MPISLVVICGTSGSGKTVAANAVSAIAPRLLHLESDAIRKRLAGIAPTERAIAPSLVGGIYSAKMTMLTYDEMFRRAAAAMFSGRSVILDGTFRRAALRHEAVSLGTNAGARVVIVECSLDRSLQVRRLEERFKGCRGASDGRPVVLALHERDWEPVREGEADFVLGLNTSLSPEHPMYHEIISRAASGGKDVRFLE